MKNSDVINALAAAERSFETSPETIEEGLDVDEAELVQLRRACRLLAAASLRTSFPSISSAEGRPVVPRL